MKHEDSDRTYRDYIEDNSTYLYFKCPNCGGKYVYKSFMVANGEDDNDWDSMEWCEDCGYSGGDIDTMTEYGEIKPDLNLKDSIIL